jgi:hypothetical protein
MGGLLSPLPGLDEGIGQSLNLDELGLGSGSSLGSSPSSSSVSSSPASSPSLAGLGQGISSTANSLLNKYGGSVAGAVASLFGLNTQAITVLLGLIFIAGGIFLFKPVQQVIVGGAKAAGKAASKAAIVA